MPIPFIDFKREWKFFEKEFIKVFKKFGRSGIYVLGPEVERFENNFAKYNGYKYAVGVATGLAALEIALRANGVKAGDEVITVSNSAVATSLAITNVGAKPIFCDIGDDFLIDADQIESLINKKTKAILPVHLFGKVCNMKKINSLARKYGLVVVEDACQAHGTEFRDEAKKNTKAFSFYPTKNLGALGEGGMIVTNDEKTKDFSLSYRNYGQKGRYNHVLKASNYRVDPLQCVLLSEKLRKLDLFIKKRRQIAALYIKAFKKIKDIEVNDFDPGSSYHLFVLRIRGGKRDNLREHLNSKKIETLIHYPTLIHKQPCYVNDYKNIKLPNSELFQNEILSLPCYPFFTVKEQKIVIDEIIRFFK